MADAQNPLLDWQGPTPPWDAIQPQHLEPAVDQVIADNPAQVEKAKANPKLAGWFVGQVMKATGGKANPKAVNELVSAKLGL